MRFDTNGPVRSSASSLKYRFIFGGILLLCQSRYIRAQTKEEQDVLPQPCAQDDTYREFERIQADAYLSDHGLDSRRLLSRDIQNRVRDNVIRELELRDREPDRLQIPQGFGGQIAKEFAALKVPTCYESPLVYFMIDKYARDVGNAATRLGFSLPYAPKFGSLPSNDINSYTYPLLAGKSSVIAINVQLFDFIYQMTELTVRATDPRFREDPISDAELISHGMIEIAYDKRAQRDFVSSIVALLSGEPVGGIELNSEQETLVIFLSGAMERFVFAHEYGHVIKGHRSSNIQRPSGSLGNAEYNVLARTWEQEFEADSIGVQLLAEILITAARQNPKMALYYVTALNAPLLFLEFLNLLDRTALMKRTGAEPVHLSEQEKADLWSCVAGSIPASRRGWCSRQMSDSHPPAWMREDRLMTVISREFARTAEDSQRKAAKQKGIELLFSLDFFWRETSTEMLRHVTSIADGNE